MISGIDYDKIYESNGYGKYKILREVEPRMYGSYKARMVEVLFLQTGYITTVKLAVATGSHAIRDPYYPKVCGVGYMGDTHMGNKKIYKCWNAMIARCYNPATPWYNLYGGIGITVCDRWLCYENFANDVKDLPGYEDYINKPGYALDKDILQSGIPHNQKVYSKETCCFIPIADNHCEVIERNSGDSLIGVREVSEGKFTARVTHNGKEQHLGTFDAPEYAATIFDYYARLYNHKALNNLDVDIGVSLQHRIGCNTVPICKKIMCKTVKNEKL
jgi:hypothetical protein